MPGKVVFEEPRSRSSSMPNLTAADQQTKLTQYWQKSSAESDESEGDSDETEENQSSVIAESMESHAKHGNTKIERKKKAEGKTRKIQMEKVNFNDTVKAFIALEGKNIFNTDKETKTLYDKFGNSLDQTYSFLLEKNTNRYLLS